MESRMDSIKTPVISTSDGGQAKTKYKRRSSRLQCLQSIECDSKDSSLKLSISASKNDPTSEQGTSMCGLCITPDQPSTLFDHEIAYELNQLEQTSTKQSEEEKCVKKYTNSKFYTNNEYVETEDVSKVFKLLSKPNFQSNMKSSLKSPLKTYANPRKSLERNEVIESFGLPDTPIVPKKPLVDSILDVEVLDAKEITFQELQFVEEPWCIIDLEESFTHTHEIRIKPDPQDHLKVCYSNSSLFAENINKSNFQKFSPISNSTNALDKHSKMNKKSLKKKLSKPEIIIENNSLALEGHEVEICKVNNSHNTSNCNLTTINTNKSPQAKSEKCGIKNKKKDINSNERNVNKSTNNRCSITEDNDICEVSKERRKLRSSSVTVSPIKTDHARGNSDNKVNDNEVDNSSTMRKLRSSVIHNTDVSNIETPEQNKKSGKKVINFSEKLKPRISINNSTDSDNNTFTPIEVKKLRSSSNVSVKTHEDKTLKINNKFVTPITHSDISGNLTSPDLGTHRRRDHHKSNKFTLNSELPTKKSNLVLKEELKRERSVISNEKRKQRFSSPRKVVQPTIEATRRGNQTVSNKPEIGIPKKTKIESIKNKDKTHSDTESTINNTARTLRAYCSEIVLKPKSLKSSKSSKIPKSQNHKVMVSKRVKSNNNYSYLTKSNSDPFLNNKESDNEHSKQLKVVLHPLNSQKNFRKDHVNNMRSNRRVSKLHTTTHAENTEKQTRSCEMLLELVDIIPISETPRDSSKLLQTKPFLNLFKNTELSLPKTLLVEDETKKTSRKPETKNATKNNASISKEDKSSKSTNNDASSICQISELIQNNQNVDSTICSEVVPTTGSEGTASSPCNMKILPEKTSLDEGMHTSPDKLEIKMTNRVKKSPETKADITELKNLIKKINEIEGRKCKVFTNEKLSECLRARSYNRKSSSGDICLANLRPTSEFQQETIEDDSISNETENKNASPTDKLRNRTRKIIEMLSEDITKPVTNENMSVASKKIDKYVQSENNTLQNNKDLIVNNFEQSYQIISEKDIHKKSSEVYKNKNLENVEIQEHKKILDLIVNDETILRKKIDTEVEAEQILEKLETHSSESQSTPTRRLRKREEKAVDTPIGSRESILQLEMVSPSENITCTGELPTYVNSSNETIKRCRGRSKKNKTVIPETESIPIRQLRKREEKSGGRPKRVVTLETVLQNENFTCIGKTPTVSNASNETVKRCRGQPKKQVNQVNKKPNEEHQEIIRLNTDFNIPDKNVFKVNSKDVSDTISTSNIPSDENVLVIEPNLIVKDIEDSSTQVSDMITEFDNNNDNLVLVASTPMKSKFDQTENTKVSIESAKINEDYMNENIESTKDHVTESRELNKNDIIESTDVIKNSKDGTKSIEDYLQVNKSDITEDSDFEKDCIAKNKVGNKNDRTDITEVADSKNKTVIMLNAILKTSSPETESTPIRQLRKREEKSVKRSKRIKKLETALPNENIICEKKTPTVSNASNETVKRSRGRPKKQVNQLNKKPNEEIISLNTDFNIPNENVVKVDSKDVRDTISTNNIPSDENVLVTEPNLIVKDIEDSSTEVSDIITEFDYNNDNLVLVASTPMKSKFDQTENTKVSIESTKINEDYMESTKDLVTESRELNKNDITEGTDVIKNSKGIEDYIPEIIQVNKNDIIENTEFNKDINVKTDDLVGTTEVNKSEDTDCTEVRKDITESSEDYKGELTESTKTNEDNLNKSSEVVRDEKCIGDNNTVASNDKLQIKNTVEDNENIFQLDNVGNIKTTGASLGVKTNNLNVELIQNTNVINHEENTLKNNEESPLPVIVNQLNEDERNSEKNDIGRLASLPLSTVECEKSNDTDNDQNYNSEGNNQQTLLDEEVSIINEYVEVENVQETQKEVESPVNITGRLRSKTSLGQRSSTSINIEETPTPPRSKTSLGKKSKNSAELSPKSPTKQRRNSEKEYQYKDKKESSPRTRNNIKTVSRLLEYDDSFKETNKSSLKERITSLEDLLDGYKNISTRTRSKTSLGERIDGNADDDFDIQKTIRSKSSLGNRVNDNERDSISPKVTRSKASLGNKANDHDQQENKLLGNDRDSTIKNSGISDNIQSEISLKESQRASRSKNPVPTAEYLNETTEETDPSKILHIRSLMPVGREVIKVVKRSHSIGSVLDMNITNLKPKVGDIVWAQIGRYPYWPSLVSKDPVSRTSKNIVKNKCMYHVKFFGDKGRRAWINGKKLMGYKSRDDLEICYKNLKKYKNSTDLQVYIVRTYVSKRWAKAVEEVEFVNSQNFTYKQILRYMDTGCIGPESLNKESEEGECSTSVLKKAIKRKLSLSLEDPVDNEQEKKIKLESEESTPTSKEKSSRKGTTKDAETSENSPTSSPKTEDSSTSKDNEEIIDFIVIKDEHSEEEYKINFNTLKNFGSYTLDEQRSLFKRNNLFKGVPKEKVCQYCFDFGELLKCKGGCNGVYHPFCATQVLLEKHPKRKKVRRSVKLEKEESIKTEKAEVASSSGNQLDVNNHVQIVTIHSSVYDTPPRKTFPPDFENMTLGERIDFKMKEIMKKFESTTYTDILSESSSEEKPTRNIPLVCSNFSAKCQDLFSAGVRRSSEQSIELDKELDSLLQDSMIQLPSAAKLIKHVTADSPGDQNDGIQNSSSESIGKKETDPPIKHVTADCEYSNYTGIKNNILSAKKETKNHSKQRNSLMKHVTADSPSSRQHSTENKDFPSEPIETKTFNGHKKLKQETDNVDSESLRSSSSRQSKQSDVSENPDAYRNINPKNFKCGFCVQDVDPYCFICNETVSKRGSYIRQKCSLYQCSRFYHPECLKLWPQTQWSVIQTTKNRYSQEEIDSFVCPQHVCHTCASDDPRAATSRCSGDKIVKCLCCPASYHSTNLCVPAGAEIITSTQIICPRHRSKRNKPYTINTTWCLLCNQGGNLICCETCPTSVHPECTTVSLTDDDRFICEDCESGRLPLYDEVVWVKLGYYKWWPALIIFPNEVPQKVYNAKHSSGEFVVKFFGTYNYYWMNRGRAFLFQEGDTVDTGLSTKKKVEAAFLKAVKEAVVAHKMKKQFKLTQSAESANSMKPPPYIKIKVSKPVGNVRFMELDLSNTTACDCNPNHINPCGPDSNCLNRLLLTECNPEVCPAGKLCKNQSFEQREYPLLIPYKTETRGWGLKTLEPVKKGQFVIEYVGELIDDEEYQRRILKMHAQKEENYYFLTIHKDRMIDAGPKGNMARFMNHCCQPNCETQKWTVNGDTRVGLFANVDIPAHTELTFNYNLECTGTEKKVCKCGAPNCSGFIGVKVKNELNENRKPKKERKKKEPEKPLVLPPCYQCQKKGNVSLCSNKICNKAYHLRCLKLKEMPEGKKFVCPWHYCNICSKRTIRCCVKCLNSFCPPHSEGNVRYDNLLGFVCSTHDPTNIKSQTSNVTLRKKRNHLTTDEAVVTSTTDDDVDDLSLLERQRQLKKSANNVMLEDENVDFAVNDSCTFSPAKEADNESQNETVSSATASDFEDEFKPKRKKKPKKRLQDKRFRLKCKNVGAHNKVTTANSLNETEVSEVAR